jgi:hypothetical protein
MKRANGDGKYAEAGEAYEKGSNRSVWRRNGLPTSIIFHEKKNVILLAGS